MCLYRDISSNLLGKRVSRGESSDLPRFAPAGVEPTSPRLQGLWRCSISPRRVQNVAPTGIEPAPTWTYLSSDWPPCPRLHCRSALRRLARLLTTAQVTRYGASTRRHRTPTLPMSDVLHWSTPHSYTFATRAVWALMVLRYAGKSNPPAISFRSGKLNPPSVHSHHPPPSSRITLPVL